MPDTHWYEDDRLLPREEAGRQKLFHDLRELSPLSEWLTEDEVHELVQAFPHTAQEALAQGWEMHGVFPHPDQPTRLHARLMREGYRVADLPFTRKGKLVPVGQYALWIK